MVTDDFDELTPPPRDIPHEASIIWLRVNDGRRRADKHSREIEAIRAEVAKVQGLSEALASLKASLARDEENRRVDRRWLLGVLIALATTIAGAALATRDSVKGLEREVNALKERQNHVGSN